MHLEVRAISEEQFRGLGESWHDLLSHSVEDPLFMSWPWMFSWWETWAKVYDLQLLLLGAYDEDGELIGLAPLYLHDLNALGKFRIRRIHFIGNAWRIGPSVRTEYVGLISRKGKELLVSRMIASYLAAQQWDELVVCDTVMGGHEIFGQALCNEAGTSAFVRAETAGVCLDTERGFSDWLSGLGQNTRLKLYNRRSIFEVHSGGSIEECQFTSEGYFDFFRGLNAFHQVRWGKPCFDQKAVQFHLRLLARLSPNQKPKLSILKAGSESVSYLYDIQAGTKVYNLQAGYSEVFHKKLSLGTLHLGYAIEDAFSDAGIMHYDFLAGRGKNSFYKSRFKGKLVTFKTVEFVRSPWLKLAYRYQSWLPRRLKSRINRSLGL